MVALKQWHLAVQWQAVTSILWDNDHLYGILGVGETDNSFRWEVRLGILYAGGKLGQMPGTFAMNWKIREGRDYMQVGTE